MLETMAKDLGYKDKITWETIQYPYIPKWLVDEMENQDVCKKGQVDFAKMVTSLNKDSLSQSFDVLKNPPIAKEPVTTAPNKEDESNE